MPLTLLFLFKGYCYTVISNAPPSLSPSSSNSKASPSLFSSHTGCTHYRLHCLTMAVHIVFFQICVALIALPIHILAFLGLWDPIVKKLFPYLLEKVTKNYNKYMAEHKKELFRNLNDFRGPSGELRVLELGCGTGANFKFYPEGCKVTCVDPNPNFKKFLSNSLAENQHIQFQAFVVAAGENMAQIPSGSMDIVICTLVLCSVDNIEGILAEAHRVLRPVSVYLVPMVATSSL